MADEKDTPCYQCITFPICKAYIHSNNTETDNTIKLYSRTLRVYININHIAIKCILLDNYLNSSKDNLYDYSYSQFVNEHPHRLECIKKVFNITDIKFDGFWETTDETPK